MAEQVNEKRVKLICTSCSYKFSRDAESRLERKCPFCSSPSVVEYKPLTADRLLKTTQTK